MPVTSDWYRTFHPGSRAFASGVAGAAAQSAELPRLHTHQSYIEEMMRPTTLDVKDPLATSPSC